MNLNGFSIVSEVTNIDAFKEESQLSETIHEMVLESKEVKIPFREEHARIFHYSENEYIIEYSDLLRLKESFENRNGEIYHMNTMINNIRAHHEIKEDAQILVSIREMNDITDIKTDLLKLSDKEVVSKNNTILNTTARNLEELKSSGVKLIKLLFN